MAFDGIVTKAVVCELNKSIINGKINKIYEPNKNEILLGIYSKGKNYALTISIDPINYRINLTSHPKQNPQNALNFCMLLRKHLMGGTIKNIYMQGLERIIYIDIECFNKYEEQVNKTLVVELMGRHSNIILINQENIIIDSLRHLNKFNNSKRDILPGRKYNELERDKKNLEDCSYEEFLKNIDQNNLANSISNNFIGISKSGIESIIEEISTENSCKKVYEYLSNTLKNLEEKNINLKIKEIKNGNKKDFYLKFADDYKYLDLNFDIDDYYFIKESEEILKSKKNYILNLILNKAKKLEDKLKIIKEKLKECVKKQDYKLYGELITANLYKIENYNQSSIVLENYYKNNEKITIPLDNKITPLANAKKYFKKYKKLQNTESIVNKQEELIRKEIEYLESLVYDINNCTNLEELEEVILELEDVIRLPKMRKDLKNKKKQMVNMPTEYKFDDFTIYVGKNNKQNDYLTCKIAKSTDLWFHTKDIHGSHVVLKVQNKENKVPDSIIYKCATMAAYFSKAKMSSNVPVDYTYIKYVKKPNGAKPGMVIYTNNKTLYVNPQKPE